MRLTSTSASLAAAFACTTALSTGLRTKKEDNCECLNWYNVYKRLGAKCGDGHELSFAYKQGFVPWLAHLMYHREFCYDFYQRIDDNACMNILMTNEPGQWYNNQWCYVPKECPQATPVNSSNIVGAKICEPGKDKLMRDYTPEQLTDMAKEFNLNIGHVMKMAYPTEWEARWPNVQALYRNDSAIALAAVNQSVVSRLHYLQSTGAGYVLDSDNQRAPFAVIRGGKTYMVEKDEANYMEGHPWTFTKWKCISNCDN